MRAAGARAEASQTDAREAARQYIARGFAVVPLPARSKRPERAGWQHGGFTADDIDPAGGIGLLLGELSGGLIDVDKDTPEAIAAARFFLPHTDMVHGRASARESHSWFI